MNQLVNTVSKALLNHKIVGIFVLLVVLFTLTVDVLGLVHPCPYCRTERFALGVLSIIILTKWHRTVLARYIAALIGGYGIIVGVMQNFNHIRKINKGEFDWAGLTFDHPWILSGLAVISLVWMLFLIFEIAENSKNNS